LETVEKYQMTEEERLEFLDIKCRLDGFDLVMNIAQDDPDLRAEYAELTRQRNEYQRRMMFKYILDDEEVHAKTYVEFDTVLGILHVIEGD